MKKILLIGFRGAGKTSLGKLLANKLKVPFKDADEEIERKCGEQIKDIVEKWGWKAFRELEKSFLKELIGKKPLVCALGGGAVLHSEEMKLLKEESLIIWVDANLDEIKRRLKRDSKTLSQRPALTDLNWEEEIEKIYKERLPLYKNWAHFRVDTSSKSLEEILEEIENYINKGG
ncbi:MAG: shikimate kinase [Thermodesulfobacteriaceae bacterium]|nr:shikimate kinase [Thermodesulfobacteriaceae bacterium]